MLTFWAGNFKDIFLHFMLKMFYQSVSNDATKIRDGQTDHYNRVPKGTQWKYTILKISSQSWQ